MGLAVGLSGPLDWSEPVTTLTGPYWPQHLVRHWTWVLTVTERAREDALGAAYWAEACRLLDQLVGPESVEQVNGRWREFVVAVWQMLEQWQARMARRQARR